MHIDSITFECECGQVFKYTIHDRLIRHCSCDKIDELYMDGVVLYVNDDPMISIGKELISDYN